MKILLLAGVLGYLGVAGIIWLLQDHLVFYPRAVASPAVAPQGWRIEEVEFTARDKTRLAGVLVTPPGARAPLVIYFGGNAEEVTAYAADVAQTYGDRAVLLVNYRGYGASTGKPGEAALVSDAIELFDWASRRPDVDADRIAVHGRSLGSSVAVQVAAARPARCVVLTSPFASAIDVAKEFYPWLPVSMLLRHRFDSLAHAPKLRMPALFLMGDADDLVPKHHSEKLAAAWAGPAERIYFEGFGHNDLDMNPRYAGTIRSFLDRCL